MPHARSYAALIMGATLTLFLPTLSFAEGQSSSESSGLPPAHGYLAESGLQQFTSIIGSLRNATPHSSSSKGKAMRLFSRLYKTGGADVRELLDTFVHQLTMIVNQKWSATRSKDTKLVILIEDSKYALKSTLTKECDISDEMIDDMMQELYTAVSPTLGDYLASVKRTALIISAVVLTGFAIWGGCVLYNKLVTQNIAYIEEKIKYGEGKLEKIKEEYKDLFDYLREMRFTSTMEGIEQFGAVLRDIGQSDLLPQLNASAADALRTRHAIMQRAGYAEGRHTKDPNTRVVDIIDRPGSTGANEVILSGRTDTRGRPLYTITSFEPNSEQLGSFIRSDLEMHRITMGGRTFMQEYATRRWNVNQLGEQNELDYIAASEPQEWNVLHSTTQMLSAQPNPDTGEHDVVRFEPSALDALGTISRSGLLEAIARQMESNQNEAHHIFGAHGFTRGMANATPQDLAFAHINGVQIPVFLSRTLRRDNTPIQPGELRTVPPQDRMPIRLPVGVSDMMASLADERSPLAQTLRTLAPILQDLPGTTATVTQQLRAGILPHLPSVVWYWSNNRPPAHEPMAPPLDPAAVRTNIERFRQREGVFNPDQLTFLAQPTPSAPPALGAPPSAAGAPAATT